MAPARLAICVAVRPAVEIEDAELVLESGFEVFAIGLQMCARLVRTIAAGIAGDALEIVVLIGKAGGDAGDHLGCVERVVPLILASISGCIRLTRLRLTNSC